VEGLAVDLADEQAIATLLAGLERLDVLVHNAAYFPLTPSPTSPRHCCKRTLAVNLGALFWLTQAALPLFRRQGGGCVLATSSVTGPRWPTQA
jgi:3-oxoacyl-[acyl-carrier protein] reductase